ncbi:MAG: hypothetical protein QOJ79_2957 [Actinomycetota bacterium]|jgi:hypothetical protein|nr:hypothetical protein [Actinomycetota bacterium]
MQNRNTFAHFLHDAGLAAWFGGSLMGAIGLNGAAADVDDPRQRARVANAGWGRWTPFNLAAIGAHLVGGAILLKENKGRVATQKGVLGNTGVKLALTGGALGATAYSRLLGQKVMNAGDVPIAGGTDSLPSTPPEVAKAQKQLKALQWAIPGLTGAVLASSSLHEEQQRPTEVLKGTLKAVPGRAAALGATAATGLGAAATGAFDKVSDKVKEAV